jgi:hypothetical protein
MPLTPDEPAQDGEMRITETGDVEIFDGRAWTPVASLVAADDVGNRDVPTSNPNPGDRP